MTKSVSSILANTLELNESALGAEQLAERRTSKRRAARWIALLSIGTNSYEAITTEVSESVVSIETQIHLPTGSAVILDIRSIHNGTVRVIRVCGFVRFVRMSGGAYRAGISIDRIAEKHLVFLRHYAKRQV